jgi:hypothetical protein
MSTEQRQAIKRASEVRGYRLTVPTQYGTAIMQRLRKYGIKVWASQAGVGCAYWIEASPIVVRSIVGNVPYDLTPSA